MNETVDGLDVSLQDFEPPPSPESLRHRSVTPSDPGMTEAGLNEEEEELGLEREPELRPDPFLDPDPDGDDHLLRDSETGSAGGYSPPAWRRLANGGRSSGFWTSNPPAEGVPPLSPYSHLVDRLPTSVSRETSPFSVDGDQDPDEAAGYAYDDGILQRAMRTRLPKGSQSPERTRQSTPDIKREVDVKIEEDAVMPAEKRGPSATPEPLTDNYIRFAIRAEVQQRTEPIEAAISFVRMKYTAMTATWSSIICSILAALVGVSLMKALMQPAATRPAGDLVKVAGVARSFEPLIYYSEHAIIQVHDLQATSIAVWDLSESVRASDMKDATSIINDLDGLSETMKTLAEEMTRFLSRVDGDMDAVLNVMDWARLHLERFQSTKNPSTLSSAYDNMHNLLSRTHILEEPSGAPTALGSLAGFVFGLSTPQREQRVVQTIFHEFLSVLEDSIQSELHHSLALFALFETVDRHLFNLVRTVARESSAQEELHADLLSGLWARILGPRSADVRKFERNRLLLRDVRDKTVRNRGILEDHNTKLLGLKASLEGLRAKLVSPLVRGANATTLSLEDQIRGISDVSSHLGDIRRLQKSRVMESMFATVPGDRRLLIEQDVWKDNPDKPN
ncbi:hypothetical protein GMORB2_0853 [Geosmithia morbida]|uniref:Uncharacterized protein n=1 Tax=Geosmithia morbida TaxID=1094350 RepID=A0A9P4Z2U2_9HYPO|nr:uncharacterized protein GMORB2_0853 [Geosmithia morbida]KAF4125609.1 hypothetical protein GMORB2_0853 [Geosmithia morbida]